MMMVIMIVIIRPLGHGVQTIYFSLPVVMFYKHMKVLLKRFWGSFLSYLAVKTSGRKGHPGDHR